MSVPNVQWITPGDGQRNCPKHVDFRTGINLEISASVGFILNKFITMHGHMKVKFPGKFAKINRQKISRKTEDCRQRRYDTT